MRMTVVDLAASAAARRGKLEAELARIVSRCRELGWRGGRPREDSNQMLWLGLAYLVGSIPFAYLFTRWFAGRDIRKLGSQNAGATNVTVSVGWLPGALTLLGDMAKGYLAVLLGRISSVRIVQFLTPAFAIAGHNWPVWLSFRGGGGLATFVGGCLAVTDWRLPLFGLVLWGALYLLLRDHDRSAVAACILLPFVTLVTEQALEMVAFVSSSSLMVLLRRIQSIKERALRRVQVKVPERETVDRRASRG